MVCIAMEGEINFQTSNSAGFPWGLRRKGMEEQSEFYNICELEIFSFGEEQNRQIQTHTYKQSSLQRETFSYRNPSTKAESRDIGPK